MEGSLQTEKKKLLWIDGLKVGRHGVNARFGNCSLLI